MKINWKKVGPHLIILGIFLTISMIYFHPALDGYTVKTHDLQQYKGMSKELKDFREQTGEEGLWTNAMFGGMPGTQISVSYRFDVMRYTLNVITLGLPYPVSTLWMYFLGFYILLMCLKVDPWIALIGSLAFGFSSYFIIIFGAGHSSKAFAIAFMAPVIGAILLILRGRLLIGGVLLALFFALELKVNHFQITYYMFFIIGAVALVEGVRLIVEKQTKQLLIASGVMLGAFILSFGANLPNLWGTYEYAPQTIRGKRILSIPSPAENDTTKVKTDGLDLDYVTQWSYGKGETFSLMIPNVKGGASGALVSKVVADQGDLPDDLKQFIYSEYENRGLRINDYWGEQPGTSGPVYIGIIVMLLAFLALFYVREWIVYALFVVTILAILLSWGKNLVGLTEFFLDYFPGYNKFRAVTMILVVAEFCLPLMGILFLKKLIENKEKVKEDLRGLYFIGGSVAFILVLFLATPNSFFDFQSTIEKEAYFNVDGIQVPPSVPEEERENYITSFRNYMLQNVQPNIPKLETYRMGVFRADATRSLLLLLATGLIIWLFVQNKMNKVIFIALLGVGVLFDLANVSLRYFNNEKDQSGEYISWADRELEKMPFMAYQGDYAILNLEKQLNPAIGETIKKELNDAIADKDGEPLTVKEKQAIEFRVLGQMTHYRVLGQNDLANDTRTSYFHKSVGGYHAAKLRRIQDMIEFHLSRNNERVLDMFNTKYSLSIKADPKTGAESTTMQYRPTALGNAWIVNDVKFVDNADKEIVALGENQGFDPANTAIIDIQYKDLVGNVNPRDSSSKVSLQSSQPNKLVYSFEAKEDQIVLFSEVFYDLGWQAYIDSKPVDHFRANYLLRGLRVPGGSKEIVFEYSLQSYSVGSAIALTASILIILGVIYLLFTLWKEERIDPKKKVKENSRSVV